MHIYSISIIVGLLSTVSFAKHVNQDFPQGTIKQLPSASGDVGSTDEEGVDDGDYADFEDYGDYEYLDAYFGPGNEHLLMPLENDTYDESMYEDPDDYTFDNDTHSSIEAETDEYEQSDISDPDEISSKNSEGEINSLHKTEVDQLIERNPQDINVMVAERSKRSENNQTSKLQRPTSNSLESGRANSHDQQLSPPYLAQRAQHSFQYTAGVLPERFGNKNDLDENQEYAYDDADLDSNYKKTGGKKSIKNNAVVGKSKVRRHQKSNKNQGSPSRNKLPQAQPQQSSRRLYPSHPLRPSKASKPKNHVVNRRRKTTRTNIHRGSPKRRIG